MSILTTFDELSTSNAFYSFILLYQGIELCFSSSILEICIQCFDSVIFLSDILLHMYGLPSVQRLGP